MSEFDAKEWAARMDAIDNAEYVTLAWQTIESAPKGDGAEYLVWDGYQVALINYDEKRHQFWVLNEFTVDDPTHWMPLPPPPNNAKIEEGE